MCTWPYYTPRLTDPPSHRQGSSAQTSSSRTSRIVVQAELDILWNKYLVRQCLSHGGFWPRRPCHSHTDNMHMVRVHELTFMGRQGANSADTCMGTGPSAAFAAKALKREAI